MLKTSMVCACMGALVRKQVPLAQSLTDYNRDFSVSDIGIRKPCLRRLSIPASIYTLERL